MASWQYRFEAVSIDGFVEQLVRYVNTGHYFYVTGRIPAGKSAEKIDQKLLDRYEIAQPRWERARRKQAGFASVHYLRFEDRFILLATHGQHAFFESHSAEQIHDCRRIGIKFGGYSIRRNCCQRTRKWHTLVRLDKPTYLALRAYLLDLAVRRRSRNAGGRISHHLLPAVSSGPGATAGHPASRQPQTQGRRLVAARLSLHAEPTPNYQAIW